MSVPLHPVVQAIAQARPGYKQSKSVDHKLVAVLKKAQEELWTNRQLSLAYKVVDAQIAAEVGHDPRQVMERQWAVIAATLGAKDLDPSGKAHIAKALVHQAVRASWNPMEVLSDELARSEFLRAGVSPRDFDSFRQAVAGESAAALTRHSGPVTVAPRHAKALESAISRIPPGMGYGGVQAKRTYEELGATGQWSIDPFTGAVTNRVPGPRRRRGKFARSDVLNLLAAAHANPTDQGPTMALADAMEDQDMGAHAHVIRQHFLQGRSEVESTGYGGDRNLPRMMQNDDMIGDSHRFLVLHPGRFFASLDGTRGIRMHAAIPHPRTKKGGLLKSHQPSIKRFEATFESPEEAQAHLAALAREGAIIGGPGHRVANWPERWVGEQPVHRTEYKFARATANLGQSLHVARSSSSMAVARAVSRILGNMGMGQHQVSRAVLNAGGQAVPAAVAAVYTPVDDLRAVAAAGWHGLFTRMPGAVAFRPDPRGGDLIHRIDHQGTAKDLIGRLHGAGAFTHTLVPTKNGFVGLVYDKGARLGQSLAATGLRVSSAPGVGLDLTGRSELRDASRIPDMPGVM